MIISADRYEYNYSNNAIRKKITYFINVLTIFVLFAVVVIGSAASSWTVYGQSNETDSQFEDLAKINPNIMGEKNKQVGNGQSSSENGPSGNDSENTGDSPMDTKESNSHIGIAKSQPDGDCLFDPSLTKCAPDENGHCPEGFYMNENEQCFPAHDNGCPDGYHSPDDDETGRCIINTEGCPSGMIFRPDMKTCGYKDDVCRTYPSLDDCKTDQSLKGSDTLAYKSGYQHGCADSKISNSSKRYINQPGMGNGYHTQGFMAGYDEGFKTCSNGNSNQPPSNTKGTFKVTVQVTNQLSEDTYGGVTINVGNYPDDIFKPLYGLYFPAGQTVSKTFTFKSSDVPVGKEFEVNLDYGDDHNQYIFGVNTPTKEPEIVQFFIA